MARARAAALQALEIDPDLPEAHAALAVVKQVFEWDFAAAEREYLRSIELMPNDAWPYRHYARMLLALGRLEEAAEVYRMSQEVDPHSIDSTPFGLPELYVMEGKESEALADLERALELEPHYYVPHLNLGNHYCRRGDTDLALPYLQRAVELSPDDPIVSANLAYCLARSGNPSEARKLLGEIEAFLEDAYVDPVVLALVHVGLGENERAIEWMEKGYAARALNLLEVGADSRFDPLRSDPRFSDLLQRIGLPTLPRKAG